MLTSLSKTMIATMSIFMVASGISVVVRLFLRRRGRMPFKADDYFVVAAWAFSAALAITNIVGVPVGGFGVPFTELSDAKAIRFLKMVFILQFWYIIAVALVKFSILCFYGRLFGIGRYPTAVIILLAVTAAWLVAFLFATFFQSWPLSCNWLHCPPATNYPVIYVAETATDIVLDVSILTLPAFYIRKLQFSGNQKIGVGAIFGLGLFCVVSSVARLAYTVQFHKDNDEGKGIYAVNFDAAVFNIVMWSGIEACASTICANLPCYGPLIGRARSVSSIIMALSSFLPIKSTKNFRDTTLEIKAGHRLSTPTDTFTWSEASAENFLESGGVGGSYKEKQSVEELDDLKYGKYIDIDS